MPFDVSNRIQRLVADPYGVAKRAATALHSEFGPTRPKVAMILGSGYAETIDRLGVVTKNELVQNFPGFVAPGVDGHAGRVMLVRVNRVPVLVFSGRTHLYEKLGDQAMPIEATVHRVRVAAAMGCKTIILTSAVGALGRQMRDGTPFRLGDPVLVRKHFSRLVPSPLSGPRFQQCHDVYSARLRQVFQDCRVTKEGGLVQVVGPHFEDVGETECFAGWGYDMVGMSVVTEAIAAADVGLETLALSTNTDYCGEKTSHTDVLKVVRKTAGLLVPTWQKFIRRIA